MQAPYNSNLGTRANSDNTDLKTLKSGVEEDKSRRYHRVFVKLLDSKSCKFTFH